MDERCLVADSRYISFLGDSDSGENQQTTNRFTKLMRFVKTYRLRILLFVGIISTALLCVGILSVNRYDNDGSDENQSDDLRHEKPIWQWTDTDFAREFDIFVEMYGKQYADDTERNYRFNIFKSHVYYINAHNSQGFSYTLRLNQFGDMTDEEVNRGYLGFNHKIFKGRLQELNYGVDNDLLTVQQSDLPDSIDWVEKGCVTPVKDQKNCGSCWAFSTTGAVEGAICAKNGEHVNLSEQELIDCSTKEGNMGCNGGEVDASFEFVIKKGGLCSEADYPYLAKEESCQRKHCKVAASIGGFKDVPEKSETALMAAISKYGPVSVAIEADQMPFHFYHSGVFDGSCGHKLDHAVLAVGYGTDKDTGMDYWLVKNSWGGSWGQTGYIKIARNRGKYGECGILSCASYALV